MVLRAAVDPAALFGQSDPASSSQKKLVRGAGSAFLHPGNEQTTPSKKRPLPEACPWSPVPRSTPDEACPIATRGGKHQNPKVKKPQSTPAKKPKGRPRKCLQAGQQSSAGCDSDHIGPVSETREEHLFRHRMADYRTCARCKYYKFRDKWLKSYGSVMHAGLRTEWLTERPARFGGTWAIGCCLCADLTFRMSQNKGLLTKNSSRVTTKWARYAVNKVASMDAQDLHQHTMTSCHKLAVAAWFRPDAPVTAIAPPPDDAELLRGCVPQPEDWLRVWRSMKTPESFRSAEKHSATEHFIRTLRKRHVDRRAFPQMAQVIAETIRSAKREWLRNSWSITLSADDRKDYRVIRFMCDCPNGTVNRRGILAVVRHGTSMHLEDYDADKSQEMCHSILEGVRRFCTPFAQETDEGLMHHILTHVRAFTADGGTSVQKAARLLKENGMPQLILFMRDPAHACRTACRDPLHLEDRFKEQLNRLFGRHGLVPDVQNSDQWRAKLSACQNAVLTKQGAQGGGVDRIMRHFSFAKQRFDSFAAPLRRYCCAIHAVALLLAMVATDKRLPPETRSRASTSLEAMTEENLLAAGIAADYAEMCLDFIRIFDQSSHDLAQTAQWWTRCWPGCRLSCLQRICPCASNASAWLIGWTQTARRTLAGALFVVHESYSVHSSWMKLLAFANLAPQPSSSWRNTVMTKTS